MARRVHDLCFNPQHGESAPKTIWSLSNAFTTAFKELEPIPQFKAAVKLGPFLEAIRWLLGGRFSQILNLKYRATPHKKGKPSGLPFFLKEFIPPHTLDRASSGRSMEIVLQPTFII